MISLFGTGAEQGQNLEAQVSALQAGNCQLTKISKRKFLEPIWMLMML